MRQNGLSDKIKDYNWEYHVIKSDQLNAWCMPGGKIAFYEGIMPVCKDDNGVAVVMAHEVAHAVARHGNERMSQQLAVQLGGMALSEALEKQKEQTQQLALLAFGVGSQVGVMLPYSRLHESEADELGLYFMAMAGYDPKGATEFWKRMEKEGGSRPPEFLSTHPNPNTRISNLEKLMPKALEYYKK
jgi:predicted Zn-dependent protease